MTTLAPAAYAPYGDPEEYILRWTDRIWLEGGMGLIREMYAPDLLVHGAYGDIVGVEAVIRGSVSKRSALPNRSGGPEDVVWEPRGENGFVSYHRALHVGPHDGPSLYGPPTHRSSVSRGIAVCLVRDAVVVEEWVVRDEYAVVEQLGFDPEEIARRIAFSSNTVALGTAAAGDRFGEPPANPLAVGESGPRPDDHPAEATLIFELFDRLWNQRMFQLLADLVHPDVIGMSAGGRTVTRTNGYLRELWRLLGPFPDAQIEVRDIAVNTSGFHGTRVAVLWRLRGTYSGAPLYGPTTDAPVEVLGSSMFLLREGRIYREWRVYDDLAVLVQIARARGGGR